LPTIALRQWQSEIAKFSKPGSIRVAVYHGGDRDCNIDSLTTADVVLTSYKIVEIEYRKATAQAKVECSICKKKFYPNKLRIHRKYFCGETSQRTEAQSKTEIKSRKGSIQAESDSDSDDITRQKKKLKTGSAVKTKSTTDNRKKSPNAKKGAGKALDSEMSSDSDSDDIARQKKKLKTGSAVKTKSMTDNRKKSPNAKKGAGKALDSEMSSDSDSDDIARQKKKLKSNSTSKASRNTIKSKSNVGRKIKDVIQNANTPLRASSRKCVIESKLSGCKSIYNDDSSIGSRESEDSASKYSASGSESSSTSDSEDTRSSQSIKHSTKRVKLNESMPKNKTKINSKTKVEKEKKDDKKSKNTVKHSRLPMKKLDDLDSEVEADIKKALLRHVKETRNVKRISILHTISWFRIILDEAHLIKDRSTSTAHSCFALVSLNKWCLTGTPLQNRVGELYSLVRFLRVDPHAYYFCKTKGCNCKSLHYVRVFDIVFGR
jgi:DNA repair protein RAD16